MTKSCNPQRGFDRIGEIASQARNDKKEERGDLGCQGVAKQKREIASQARNDKKEERGDLGCSGLAKQKGEIA